MRVVTLLPAATEIVAALGAADRLVGISHECDYPPDVDRLPRVTATPVDAAAPSGAIDAEVRRLQAGGRPVIAVDAGTLERLAPDLIVTQGLCEVCAVADGEVHRLAAALRPAPRVLSLGASSLAGIFQDIRTLGCALGLDQDAEALVSGLEARLARLRAARGPGKPRVVCLEWLDPLYLAGHWVPELVEAAGGEDVGAQPGSHSTRRSWADVARLRPEIGVVMLCGFGVERARRELESLEDSDAAAVLAGLEVWLIDGNAYTSRPGPRVVDGAERLQAIFQGRELPGIARRRSPSPAGRQG